MGKPRMNNKTTQWRQPVGFACGYVVARLEPKGLLSSEDAAYYCVASSGEEELLFGNELRDRILKGSNNLQERGKYSCDFLNATVMQNGSIRLSTGITTVKLPFKKGEASIQKVVAQFYHVAGWRKRLTQAVEKAEKSWYATHDKVEEKAPAKKSGAINKSVYGGDFKMPADVKRALEEFKKAHPELVTKKALAATREFFVGVDEFGSLFEFMRCYNMEFVSALRQCYGTEDIKVYPDDLLAFIQWRMKGSFITDPHQWLQDGVVAKDKGALAHLIGSMMIWRYCGDWTDPEFRFDRTAYKFLVETAETKEQREKGEKAYLALRKKPVWWRMAYEVRISGAVFERSKDGTAYGRGVIGRNFLLEEDFFVKHKEYMEKCRIGGAQRKAYYPERYKENHPDLPASVPMKDDEE